MVIILIAILIGLLLPQVEKVRSAASMIQCQNNLKQLANACHNYNSAHGQFPTGTVVGSAKEPGDRLGVMVELLPSLERDPLYQQFDLKQPWRSAANKKGVATESGCFLCPASNFGAQPANCTNYVGIAGAGADAAALPLKDPRSGIFGDSRSVKPADVKDGLANTLLFLETRRDLGPWAAGGSATLRGIDPDENPQVGRDAPFGLHVPDRTLFRRHPMGSAMAVMADGSAKKVPETVRADVLAALATIAGHDPVEIDW